jgi:hypothetical protein
MTRLIFILLLFFSTISRGQTSLDTANIYSSLFSAGQASERIIGVHNIVILTIQAIDKNINAIVQSVTSHQPQKFTVIECSTINVRQLVDKAEAIKIILSDTATLMNFQEYWNKSNHDTIEFLSGMFIKSEFDLHYPNGQYPKQLTSFFPLEIQHELKCNHILFDSKQLNLKIDSITKTLSLKERSVFYNYMSENFDYFSKDTKKLQSQPIRIVTITFSSENIYYAGVDIYDTHYLLSFDSNESWELTSTKILWTY